MDTPITPRHEHEISLPLDGILLASGDPESQTYLGTASEFSEDDAGGRGDVHASIEMVLESPSLGISFGTVDRDRLRFADTPTRCRLRTPRRRRGRAGQWTKEFVRATPSYTARNSTHRDQQMNKEPKTSEKVMKQRDQKK
ncbi:hypothetical protein EDD85DRAFT_788665 [Armillaria nabsnona]|nr:hypothetical protein EDD85DRAFT_788665 [Armillaria nabsnona]